MKNIVFNGKFLTASPTGVHRVAEELIIALDGLLDRNAAGVMPMSVIAPQGAMRALDLSHIGVRHQGALSGKLKNIPWEQVNLPLLTRDTLLLNLCNLGPVWHRNLITMIHDAQVYLTPDSYSAGFRAWYRLMLPMLGKRSSRILTVSEYSKTQLVKYGVASADKIVVIHNGCDQVLRVVPDQDFVARSGLTKGRFVLALANTQAHKNIQVLLKAFAAPELQDMTLVLFGAATRSDFERRGLKVPDNVQFVGRVSDEQLSGLMREACALACPSLTEGFGLPPLEAMRLGCPAIIAPCGALPEVCGDAALQADAHDARQWVNHIRHLADNPEFSTLVSQRSIAQATPFTWEAAAQRLLAVINEQTEPAVLAKAA